MAKIQDENRLYSFLRPYVDFGFRHSYRRVQYVGLDRIPTDGAVIFAPNHSNALQDALAVLSLNAAPKVFVARADIFRKPTQAKILHFLKIMPIMRIRDGFSNLTKNDEIMERAVDVLIDGVPFCILPEGTHRAKHSLLPLSKGIFRIALRANERLAGAKPVYIVPIGIEYGNYFRYRSSLLVTVGTPINVTTYVSDNQNFEVPELYNGLRDVLTMAMRRLILWIPDDDNYEPTLELCYLLAAQYHGQRPSLAERLHADQRIVSAVQSGRLHTPEPTAKLLSDAGDFAHKRRDKHIGVDSIQQKHLFVDWMIKTCLLLLLFPYFCIATVATAPVWIAILAVLTQVKDSAFRNSCRCVVTILLLPLSLLACAVAAFCLMPCVWAVVVCVLLLPANVVFHEYLRMARLWLSHARLLFSPSLRQHLHRLQTYTL
ncbi:MAG: 1-acyl-sn-glycerol-3-phosphate acyltransferase [Paludibacteraceae bacterium]